MGKVAIITTNRAGWKSIRRRWEENLPRRENFEWVFFHLEDFARPVDRLTSKLGHLKTLSNAAAGRQAVKAAVGMGCTKIVLATIHYALVLPRISGLRYYVYGDATPRQLNELDYAGKGERMNPWLGRLFSRNLSRLASEGHHFLCCSSWYGNGIIEEFGAKRDQISILPPDVDTDYWSPIGRLYESGKAGLRIIFVGADFKRKGGDLLLEVAALPAFAQCEWHFVTKSPQETNQSNLFFYAGFNSDDAGLRDLVRSCDLFALPTRADCSSIATIEASACGLPVVSTRMAGIPEIVVDGHTGTLVSAPPTVESVACAIKRYLDNPSLRVQHGKNGRLKAVREYGIDAGITRLIEILQA